MHRRTVLGASGLRYQPAVRPRINHCFSPGELEMSELKILKFSQLERPAILLTHRYRGRGRAPLLPARLYRPNEPQQPRNLRRRPPKTHSPRRERAAGHAGCCSPESLGSRSGSFPTGARTPPCNVPGPTCHHLPSALQTLPPPPAPLTRNR